jgi:hypothetical protein
LQNSQVLLANLSWITPKSHVDFAHLEGFDESLCIGPKDA